MKKNKIMALLSALSIMATTVATTPVFAEEEYVNVAVGKYVTSSQFGGGAWDGGDVHCTVNALVDGGKDVYVSPLPEYGTDVITIDLLGDYTVKTVEIETYGNDDPNDAFYLTNSTFKVVAKKTLDDVGVELTREMNGDSGYFPISSGGYHSDFNTSGSDKYRYIEVTYTEGANSLNGKEHVDARIPEIKVYAPASEAQDEESKMIVPISFGKPVTAGCDATWGAIENVTDGKRYGNFYAYAKSNGEAWVIIDLGYAYPISMVVPDIAVGGVSDVIVSNEKDFSSGEYLIDEDGKWTLDAGVDNMYRYVKVVPTVAQSSASDTTLSTNYSEVIVYSTPDAVEEDTGVANIKSKATMSTNGYDAFWPVANAVDGNLDTNAGIYNITDDQYIQADLGSAYDISSILVTVSNEYGWAGAGKVRKIQLSNDSNFNDYIEMDCSRSTAAPYADHEWKDTVEYQSEWTYSGDKAYQYIRMYGTAGTMRTASFGENTDENPVFIIRDMDIFGTVTGLQDISKEATMSINGDDQFWPVAQAVDGNIETTAGIYGATEQSYIQADMGHAQDIKSILVTNANQWGWTGTGKARTIQLSNDPNFTTYEEMVCCQRINTDNGNKDYVDYQSEWLYAGEKAYRYVRIYPTPAAASYTNWGDDTTPSFAIKEMQIYATAKSASLKNVIQGKTATLTNGDWMFGSTNTILTDGNNNAPAYAASALAVFELDYPMDIERVEIDLRADGEVTDADRHYEVYLSNTGTKEGALKLLGVEENHQQIALNTIVLPVDSTDGYKYILVGSESNFWGLTEVRAMSTGEEVVEETPEEPEEPEEPVDEITNELTGDITKGSVLTLTTSYTLAEAINKTVNLYIARYDDGKLTDVLISEDVVFEGTSGGTSLEYTITEDVTVQTEFKGFVWEKGTLIPFAVAAELEAPYAEYWVDPNAATNGDGSEASPFNSFVNARDAVRNVIPSMEGDIVINLKGGTYRTDDQNYLVLGNADGGANGYNVIWKNAPGETPVISGSMPVKGFVEGDDGIWYADASEFDSIYALTVNGKAARIAGTEEPIHASKLYGKEGNVLTGYCYTEGIGFSKNDLPEITNASDAFVHVASSWVDVMYTVNSVVEDGENYKYVVDTDRLKASTNNELVESDSTVIDENDYFYVENAKELLDNPGEFYFGDGKLYYMPRTGEDMTSAKVEAAVTDYLANILGSRDNHVKNIVIRGIKFENTAYDLAYANGFTTRQAQVVNFDGDTFVQGSIWVDYADNIEISDCEFTSIAKPCISFVEGVRNSTITRNKFSNIGNSAVVIGTNNHDTLEYAGEERCEGNTISDNIIENPAMIFRGSPAIACYYVADTDIAHNKITNCNYTGISLGWGWANYPDLTYCANNTVANNYIENVNLIASDGGAIYTLGNLPDAVVEGNYYVQTKAPQQAHILFGLYFDEGTQNVTATNNVIDMAAVSASGGELYAISAWTDTIKKVTATGNYATLTNVQNEGTNCTIQTPTAYTAGSEPAAVQEIIAASAINLK